MNQTSDHLICRLSLYHLSWRGLKTNASKNSNIAAYLGPVLVDLLVYMRGPGIHYLVVRAFACGQQGLNNVLQTHLVLDSG